MGVSSPPSRLVSVSAVVVVAGVAVEAGAAFLAVTPVAARLAPFAWAPFVVAVVALALAGTTKLSKVAVVSGLLGLLAALGIGCGMAAVSLAGASVTFACALLAGEVLGAGVHVAGGDDAVATGLSLFSAALVVTALSLFGERLDVAMGPAGVAVGGGVAMLQLACARYADGAVALRFGPRDVVAAATARLTEVPRRVILAVLGGSGAQEST